MGKVGSMDPCEFQGKSDMVSQLQPLIVIVFSHMYVMLIEDIKGGKTYIGNRLRLVGEVHSPDGCFTFSDALLHCSSILSNVYMFTEN